MTRLLVTVATLASLWMPSESRAQEARKLAPGVLTVIPSAPLTEEMFQGPIPLRNVSKLDWEPNFSPKTSTLRDMAEKTVLRRNIWNLEFAFKPLRMIHVDVPQANGKMQRKLVWYMVYRVKNNGRHMVPLAKQDQFEHKTYSSQLADEVLNIGATAPQAAIRFYPQFVLESRERKKSYLDRVIPVAVEEIQKRESGGAKILNTVEITRVGVPLSTPDADRSVWGVVTWMDIDPETDFFYICVQGLTNAFRLEGSPTGGILYRFKTLQLNFWRPSDQFYEHEREIRYGVPSVSNPDEQAGILAQYGLQQRVDYLWVYR